MALTLNGESPLKLTAELSLYPLQQDYIPIIKSFIDDLLQESDIEIARNAMSTQICGDYDRIFEIVSHVLGKSVNAFGKQVLVCKFIPGDLGINHREH